MSDKIVFPTRYPLYHATSAIRQKAFSERAYKPFISELASDVLDDSLIEDAVIEHLVGNSSYDLSVDELPDQRFIELTSETITAELEASWILSRSENEDSVDSGILEGVEDSKQRLIIAANEAVSMDVRDYLNEVLEGIQGDYEDNLSECEDELESILEKEQAGNALSKEELALKAIFSNEEAMEHYAAALSYIVVLQALTKEYEGERKPILPGSAEEAAMIASFLFQARDAGWAGGGPLGSSYVDGRSTADESVYNFIKLDKEARSRLAVYPFGYTGSDYREEKLILDAKRYVLNSVLSSGLVDDQKEIQAITEYRDAVNAQYVELQSLADYQRYQDKGAAFPDMVRSLLRADYIAPEVFEDMLRKRDLSGMDTRDIEAYLCLVHPEVFAAYMVQSSGNLTNNVIDLLSGENADKLSFEGLLGRTDFSYLEVVNDLAEEVRRDQGLEADSDLEP